MVLQHAIGFFIPRPVMPEVVSTIFDIDGNEYHTVIIGSQEWIVENLKVTKYADGTSIPNLTVDADWIAEDGSAGHDGAYCWYDNDIANKPDYGALYNWFAVDKKFDDWFLPSYAEFGLLWLNLYNHGIGDLAADGTGTLRYWASDETDANNAVAFDFFDDTTYFSNNKSTAFSVRACRKFIGISGAYNLRDIGPAGGWIFYIVDLGGGSYQYYEVAPFDQSSGYVWSNVASTLLGTTTAGIGTGQSNTTAIINQVGHTNSAAKLCADFEGINKLPYFTLGGLPSLGWRVPTYSDLQTLQTTIGGGSNAGVLKEVGTSHWDSGTGATNTTGFTSVGAGGRQNYGSFFQIKQSNTFWSSGQSGVSGEMFYIDNSPQFVGYIMPKGDGLTVRCVRDV